MYKALLILSACCAMTGHAAEWHGYAQTDLTVDGHAGFIRHPVHAAAGRPWVWRTSFPDYHAEVDLELLRNGWTIAHLDCVEMLGCDASLDLMDRFYSRLVAEFHLGARPALEAVSRGGLHAYRYAARRPDRVACIYADVPVMNLASWPLRREDAKKELCDALRYYGFKDEEALRAYRGNPVDLLEPLARAKIPLRHVISLNDAVVPPEQNTLEAQRRLVKLGHTMEVVTVKEGTPETQGHHLVLPQVSESARFIMQHSAPKHANSSR